MSTRILRSLFALSLLGAAACTVRRIDVAGRSQTDDHDMSAMGSMSSAGQPRTVSLAGEVMSAQDNKAIPAGAAAVAKRLQDSPRHGEWAIIKTGPGDSVRAWVVYPRRADKAPVVIVLHEIFGESTWIRGVADQVAADGYIAIAPDLLTGKVELDHDTSTTTVAMAAIRGLKPADIQRQLTAVAKYGMGLPSALPKYGIVGFCWGGGESFLHAVESPTGLAAAVVYYGGTPIKTDLPRIKVPVLAFYPTTDARTTAMAAPTDTAMRALGKPFQFAIYQDADHGFLRLQDKPANVTASDKAWASTIEFFKKNLGS